MRISDWSSDVCSSDLLTEAGFSNTAVMNKAGSAMIVTRSSPTQPPQVYAASADGRRSGWISENRIDAKHPYAPYLAAHRPVTRSEEHTSELQSLMRI